MQAIFYLFFSLLLIWDATIFLLLVASPFFSNRLRRRNHLPDILLLIPAHNEEMVIGHTLSSLKDCPARVVVIADHCTDRTLDIVKRAGFEAFIFDKGANSTKSKALSAALQHYKNQHWRYLMVMDADNVLSANFWHLLPHVLALSPEVVQVEVRPSNPGHSMTTKMITVIYAFLNRVIQRGRAVFGLSANLCGTGMLFRKDILVHRAPWTEDMGLVEDIYYQIRLCEKNIPIHWYDCIWVLDEKPLALKSGVVQGSRWLRGRMAIAIECISLLKRKPLFAISVIWALLPKPVFWLAFISALLNHMLCPFSWETMTPFLLFPWLAWIFPSLVFKPYRIGPIAVVFPFWQMGIQVMHLVQAIWDRGKGWRHTRHFGKGQD